MLINKHWFEMTQTKLVHKSDPTWVATPIANNENKSESFAGAHSKHLAMFFDEASAIPDNIWEVTAGAMSTPGALWVAMGNGTRNTGAFFETFHSQKHRWKTTYIDSRDCYRVNQELVQQYIDDYGIDSDIVKVRWLGKFPASTSDVLIPSDKVDEAAARTLSFGDYINEPVVFGVDVARSGSDHSVIVRRQGRKVQILKRVLESDLMKLVKEIVELYYAQNS